MESEAVRRRVNTISAHFAARIVTEDVTAATSHLFPLNCSSSLSTPLRRLDNRIQFGRQASAAQGYFMRQAINSLEQGKPVQRPRACSANYIEEKSTVTEPPLFSRPATEEPLFSRTAKEELNCSNGGLIERVRQDKMLSSKSECPKFARPGAAASTEAKQYLRSRTPMCSPQISGSEWTPRVNVAESRDSHVITVELPGVDISDIRVEMDDNKLYVKGKRTMKWWKAAGCASDSFATYHKREISQGPYVVEFPLPTSADKDSVFAEFVEGILQITIPKH